MEDDEEVEGVSEREGLRLAAEDEDGRDEDGGGEDDERVDRRAHYRHVRANLWAMISPVVVVVVASVDAGWSVYWTRKVRRHMTPSRHIRAAALAVCYVPSRCGTRSDS